MFEKIISETLNKFLGAFVANVDSKQLGASIYKGELLLTDMRLQSTLFDNLPVPFALKFGQIGKIHIKIPFWDMFKSPLVVEIENIVGIAQIKPMSQWNETQTKEAFIKAQQSLLEQFEILTKQKQVLEQTQKEDSSGSFGQKLLDRILNNVKISLKNIYFRFEDTFVDSKANSSQFVIGLKLQEFSVFTTDQNFQEIEDCNQKAKEAGDRAFLAYKKLVIKGFSIFCDWQDVENPEKGSCNIQRLEDEHERKQFVSFKKILDGEFGKDRLQHKAIIDNFYVELRIQFNKNIADLLKPATFNIPQLTVWIQIGEKTEEAMTFSIYQPQIIRILKTLEIIGYFNEFKNGVSAEFYSAQVSDLNAQKYLECYEEWKGIEASTSKKDIIQAKKLRDIMRSIEEPTNAIEIIELRQIGQERINQYKGQQEELDELEAKIKKEISNEIGLTGIFMANNEKRKITDRVRAKYEGQKQTIINRYAKKQEKLSQNFKQLIQELKNEDQEENQIIQARQDLKKKESWVYPDEYLILQLNLTIYSLDFTLDNEYDQRLVQTRLHQLCLNFQLSKKCIRAKLTLDEYWIKDLWSDSDLFPYLAQLKENDEMADSCVSKKPGVDSHDESLIGSDQEPFLCQESHKEALSIYFEKNSDFKVSPFHLDTRFNHSMFIVALIPLIIEVKRTLMLAIGGQKLDLKYYEKAAADRINELRQQAQTIQKEIEQTKEHFNISLFLLWNAPVIILPEKFYKDENQNQIEVHLGSLHASSHLLKYKKKINYKEVMDEQKLYDKYELKFHGLSIKHKSKEKELHLLQNISSQVDVYNCLDHYHPIFPSIKLNQFFDQNIEFIFQTETLGQIFRIQNSLTIMLEDNIVSDIKEKIQKQEMTIDMKNQIKQKLARAISTNYFKQVDLIRVNSQKKMKESLENLKLKQTRTGFNLQRKASIIAGEQFFQRATGTLREVNQKEFKKSVRFECSSSEEDSFKSDSSVEEQVSDQDLRGNLSAINSSNTRIKRLNTMSLGFSQYTNDQKQQFDIEYNFGISKLIIKVMGEYDLIFEMKNLKTQVFVENGKDIAIDLSIQALQIREGLEKNLIFSKVVSCPFDDYRTQALQNNPNFKLQELEQQVHVQVFIKQSEIYDSSTQIKISKKDIDVACLFNRIRIIYNLQTVARALVLLNQLNAQLCEQNKLKNKMILDDKIRHLMVLRTLSGLEGGTVDCKGQDLLIKKIFGDFSIQQGKANDYEQAIQIQNEQISQFYQFCAIYCCQNIWANISNLKTQIKINIDQKMEIVDQELLCKTNFLIQRNYKEILNRLKIMMIPQGPQLLQLLSLNLNEGMQSNQKKEDVLYVIKIDPFQTNIDVKVKLRSIEMWIIDYEYNCKPVKEDQSASKQESSQRDGNLASDQKAQILKLALQTDFFMDSEEFSRFITSSKKMPPKNILNNNTHQFLDRINQQSLRRKRTKSSRENSFDGTISEISLLNSAGLMKQISQGQDNPSSFGYDENYNSPENLVYETKVLRNKSNMTVNITGLQIQNVISRDWATFQNYTQNIYEKKYGGKADENPKEERISNSDSNLAPESISQYSGPPMNYKDLNSELQFSDSKFYSSNKQQNKSIHHEGIEFSQSKILAPTSVSVFLVLSSQSKKISFQNIKVDIDPMFVKIDFKDVALMYYFLKKNDYSINKHMKQHIDKLKTNNQSQNDELVEDIEQGGEKVEESVSNMAQGTIEELPSESIMLKEGEYKTIQSVINVKIKSLVISINDGDQNNFIGVQLQTPIPLIEFCISELIVDIKSCKFVEKISRNPYLALTIQELIEKMHTLKAFEPPFQKVTTNMQMYATYYNQMSQAFEPFLEPWILDFEFNQKTEQNTKEIQIYSQEFLNLNLSYGMAVNIMEVSNKILDKIDKVETFIRIHEANEKSNHEKKIVEPKRDIESKNTIVINKRDTLVKTKSTYLVENQDSSHDHDHGSHAVQSSIMHDQTDQNFKKSGFKFFNYTGTQIKLCISDPDLDENMLLGFHRQNNVGPKYNKFQNQSIDKVIKIDGDPTNHEGSIVPVFKEQAEFEQQLLEIKRKQMKEQFTGTQDFIEDEPLRIDLKIAGIKKLYHLPIEQVGVHSFVAQGICQLKQEDISLDDMPVQGEIVSENRSAQEKKFSLNHSFKKSYVEVIRPIGLIVNVKAEGRKRLICLESQLLLTNNVSQSITLMFKINSLNQFSQDIQEKRSLGLLSDSDESHLNMGKSNEEEAQEMLNSMLLDENQIIPINKKNNEVRVQLAPNDIFRVPLIWLMKDSNIDLLIQLQSEDDSSNSDLDFIEIYKNISSIFNLRADDKHLACKIQSKQMELHDDFYVSVDIQGYKCLPMKEKSNPVQYVMSFNPPLMLTNLCMSPLELIEIDNPCTPQCVLKTVAKIAPKTSSYLISLDMSDDNKSWIRFVFTDRAKNLMISTTIDKFKKSCFYIKDEEDYKEQKKEKELTSSEEQFSENHVEIQGKPKSEINTVKFLRHKTLKEYNDNLKEDGTPLEEMLMEMESVKKIFTNIKAYHENFIFRERLFDISNAKRIIMYPRYIVVNKTKKDLICDKQVIPSFQNDYLMYDFKSQKKDKSGKTIKASKQIKFEVEGYEKCQEIIDLNHVGTSGVITMNSIDVKNDYQQLQFGIHIGQAPHPFSKTTIITIVPRYVLVNKLEYPILVRQPYGDFTALGDKKQQQGRPKYKYLKVDNDEGQCQTNLHLNLSKQKKQKTIENKIQFRAITADQIKLEGQALETYCNDQDESQDRYWCLPFSVDDIEDFQTEYDFEGQEHEDQIVSSSVQKLDKNKFWYQPQSYNQFKMFSRVIITLNPTDNDSTILIIFDEPQFEEFLIKNQTDYSIKFAKFDNDAKKCLEEPITVQPSHQAPFVWNYREKLIKRIQIAHEGKTEILSLDKTTENNDKKKLFKNKEMIFFATVKISTDGTKIVNITQEKRQKNETEYQSKNYEDEINEEKENQNKDGFCLELNFKGFGISIIDNSPNELLYFCIDDVNMKIETCSQNVQDEKNLLLENQFAFLLDIGNIQIDNLINEEYPVLFGAKDYYDKNVIVANRASNSSNKHNLSHNFRQVLEQDLKPREIDKSGHEKDRLPFVIFKLGMIKKTQKGKIGSIIRYESIHFGIQEFFLQVETTILNDNIKFLYEILSVFGKKEDGELLATDEKYEEAFLLSREDTCPMVDASKGIVFDEKNLNFDKISFGIIMLGSIKTNLTFKLNRRAFETDFLDAGIVSLSELSPFLTNFASITGANLQLNELVIIEGFFSQQRLIQNLLSHFINQGKREVLKIVGSSDMLGNPVGLFNKIGVGFVELRREPAIGMRQGPAGFVKGLGKGLGGMVRGVVGGTFDSVDILTGSLYSALKESTWGVDTRDDQAENIGQGLVFGIKGVGQELYHGVTGIVKKPWEGGKQGGIKGFSKGAGKGLVGLVVTPVTATLRLGQSISQGISGSVNDLANLGKTKMAMMDPKKVRIRPPRRIDVRNQIKIYDEDLAIINMLMKRVNNGLFSDQQIRFYAVLPTITSSGMIVPLQKSLIIITNEYLMYMKVFNFVDFLKEKNQQRTLLLSEKLTNILNYNVKRYDEHKIQQSVDNSDEEDESLVKPQDNSDYTGHQYFFSITFKSPIIVRYQKDDKKSQSDDSSNKKQKNSKNSKSQSKKSSEFISQELSHSCSESLDKSKEECGDTSQYLSGDNEQQHQHQHNHFRDDDDLEQGLRDPLIKNKNTYNEQRDGNSKYQFVMYSPSLEIFKRMHQIFSQTPEVLENIKMTRAEWKHT